MAFYFSYYYQHVVTEICPPWANFQISGCGKYLGFFVGPSSANASWDGPIAKYEKRVLRWSSKHLGLFLTIFAYKVYIQPVLTFVSQLCDLAAALVDRFHWALRRLVPGPGNWIMHKDLIHLRAYGMHQEFCDVSALCMAFKLRATHFAVLHVVD